jgi:hypothetical protein
MHLANTHTVINAFIHICEIAGKSLEIKVYGNHYLSYG